MKKFEQKDIGSLINKAIIELQKLQVEVSKVDDDNHSIGVALSEVEHKLHAASDLLEVE
ncbi:hypothetical protein [Lysinibacillus sp. FSL W8-0992]|uniref:hypothetical protein n=1 Tax=Lysinibacillus sp. FSL W8-0992 TaxID=2954643 RepID=UPI0030FC2C2C